MTYSTTDKSHATVVADIGGTHILMGHVVNLVPSAGERVDSTSLRTEHAPEALALLLERYIENSRIQVATIVVGIPGLLDKKQQTISHCNNIPELQGSGLRHYLAKRFGCRVLLQQDVMLQLLGEWRSGAAIDSESVFGVYFGTGIGTAYLQDGDPYRRGSSSLQAGHIPISDRGKSCLCGNTDCVEAYASGHTLTQLAIQHDIDVSQVFSTPQNVALGEAINEFVYYQACLLATLITVTEPDLLVIGGGIPRMQGYPRQQLLTTMRDHLQHPHPAETTQIRWAELDSHAPLYGALALTEMNFETTPE